MITSIIIIVVTIFVNSKFIIIIFPLPMLLLLHNLCEYIIDDQLHDEQLDFYSIRYRFGFGCVNCVACICGDRARVTCWLLSLLFCSFLVYIFFYLFSFFLLSFIKHVHRMFDHILTQTCRFQSQPTATCICGSACVYVYVLWYFFSSI